STTATLARRQAMASCRRKPTGRWNALSFAGAHRLDRAPPSCPVLRSVKTPSLAQAALSPKMSHPTPSWPAIPPGSFVPSKKAKRTPMHASNDIPFLDLVTPHVELEQELTAVFRRAL